MNVDVKITRTELTTPVGIKQVKRYTNTFKSAGENIKVGDFIPYMWGRTTIYIYGYTIGGNQDFCVKAYYNQFYPDGLVDWQTANVTGLPAGKWQIGFQIDPRFTKAYLRNLQVMQPNGKILKESNYRELKLDGAFNFDRLYPYMDRINIGYYYIRYVIDVTDDEGYTNTEEECETWYWNRDGKFVKAD
jgi:hypothetical protein